VGLAGGPPQSAFIRGFRFEEKKRKDGRRGSEAFQKERESPIATLERTRSVRWGARPPKKNLMILESNNLRGKQGAEGKRKTPGLTKEGMNALGIFDHMDRVGHWPKENLNRKPKKPSKVKTSVRKEKRRPVRVHSSERNNHKTSLKQ